MECHSSDTLFTQKNSDIKIISFMSFKVFLGDNESGPWKEVLHDYLKDPRNVGDIPPVSFNISPVGASFVRFQLLSYYGSGGGLQYFSTCPASGRLTHYYF